MTAHAKLGASSAKRWMACPGSVALCEKVPEGPESPYAKEGTTAHALAQACLENGIYAAVDGVDGVEGATDEMAGHVQHFLDAVYAAAERSERTELYVEKRLTLADDMFGTGDAIVTDVSVRALDVFDYKHGAGVFVETTGNPQLLFYALAAYRTFPEVRPKRVSLHIVQPRAGDVPVRSVHIDRLDLLDFEQELMAAAERARQPNAPLATGEHCRWCKAAAVCPKLESEALAAAKDEFGAMAAPTAMSAQGVGERLRMLPILKTWLKAFEEFATAEAKAGRMPDGFKFVAGSGRRQWNTSTPAVIEQAIRAKWPVMPVLSEELKSVAQLEKDIGKKDFAELCAHLVEKKPGAPTLVPVEDKREALSVSDISGF